eukprot:3496620-Rhodomonas_salina.2
MHSLHHKCGLFQIKCKEPHVNAPEMLRVTSTATARYCTLADSTKPNTPETTNSSSPVLSDQLPGATNCSSAGLSERGRCADHGVQRRGPRRPRPLRPDSVRLSA